MSHRGFWLKPSKLTCRPAGGKKRVEFIYGGIPNLKVGNSSKSPIAAAAAAAAAATTTSNYYQFHSSCLSH